ncbi:MAG: hypothetical protein Q9173_001792 [Seirophora scorigena]
MGDFGFGQKIGMMDDPSLGFILNILQKYSWRMGFYHQFPQLSSLNLESVTSFFLQRTEVGRKWDRWSTEFSSAIKNASNRNDRGRFSIVLDSKDPQTGTSPPERELWAEGSFMMLAGSLTGSRCTCTRLIGPSLGSDNSATTMCATLFYLTANGSVYENLIQEIRHTFSCVEDIRMGAALDSCTYLSACIDESMRMSPPTPRAPWREVQEGGAMVDGTFIPEGYDVGTYSPERWIPSGDRSKDQINKARQVMNPFSVGPWSCTGRSMALLQIKLLIARIAWLYDFKRAGGSDGQIGEGQVLDSSHEHVTSEYELQAHITAACNGPVLVYRQRDDQDIMTQ